MAPPSRAGPRLWRLRVIDNVSYVGSAGISAWIVSAPAGLILIDTGMAAYAPQLEASIRRLGFRLSDVRIILISHAHFNHAGALARIRADSGASLMASAPETYALEHGVYAGSEDRRDWDFPPVHVDGTIADGGVVALGGVRLTAMITPGHTAGCTNYLLPVRDAGRRHTAFFFGSASVAANRLVGHPQYPWIVADYRRTYAPLKAVDADVLLAPHAEFFDLAGKRARLGKPGANPFIVPGELRRLAAQTAAARKPEG